MGAWVGVLVGVGAGLRVEWIDWRLGGGVAVWLSRAGGWVAGLLSACRLAGWLGVWVDGCVAGWLVGWAAGGLCGLVAGCRVAVWLGGWMAC